MKNKIISFGWLGMKICYLNLTEEEAIKRFKEHPDFKDSSEDEMQGYIKGIDVIEFTDQFGAYCIHEGEN